MGRSYHFTSHILLVPTKTKKIKRMKAQKRHKSIKRKHCGDGGSFTLACSTTYKVIEELLSIPISKLRLTPAKNGFCNEVFEVECEDCTRAIVKVYSNASKIRMEPDESLMYYSVILGFHQM